MMCYTFNIMIANKIYLGKQQYFLFSALAPQTFQFFVGRTAEQKGKKERGLGKGIFALLRIKLERFRFSLIKKKPKQKIFQILLKEKISSAAGGEKKGGGEKIAPQARKKEIVGVSVILRITESQNRKIFSP